MGRFNIRKSHFINIGPTKTQKAYINSTGLTVSGSLGVNTNITCNAITCSSTANALYVSGGGASIFSGKLGIVNAFSQAYLHLGKCEVIGANPAVVLCKKLVVLEMRLLVILRVSF